MAKDHDRRGGGEGCSQRDRGSDVKHRFNSIFHTQQKEGHFKHMQYSKMERMGGSTDEQ